MLKVSRSRDVDGQKVIYVEECNKYEYENPEIPLKPINRHGVYIRTKNDKNPRIDDIIYKARELSNYEG